MARFIWGKVTRTGASVSVGSPPDSLASLTSMQAELTVHEESLISQPTRIVNGRIQWIVGGGFLFFLLSSVFSFYSSPRPT